MSDWIAGSPSGPSPFPLGPWHFSQLAVKSFLPFAITASVTASGLFSAEPFDGIVQPRAWGGAATAPAAAAEPCPWTAMANADTPSQTDTVAAHKMARRMFRSYSANTAETARAASGT